MPDDDQTPQAAELSAAAASAAPDQAPSELLSRRHQMFPLLSAGDVQRMRRFACDCSFEPGSLLLQAGQPGAGLYVLLQGAVEIVQRDGLGHERPIITMRPGHFVGEVGSLTGRPSLVDARALEPVHALCLPPEQLRALIIAEADLGERLVRSLILRRVGLIEAGASGPVLIGRPDSADVLRLQNFLRRNGYPYQQLDATTDPEAASLMAQYGAAPADAVVVCPDGSVLLNPDNETLARCMGMVDDAALAEVVDVAIVGAGPAGLATAVYAASEGLSVAVLDCRAFGGQAGASARIENYLGFPTGISGQALAGRAYVQAQKFGARMLIPAQVAHLECHRSADCDAGADMGTDEAATMDQDARSAAATDAGAGAAGADADPAGALSVELNDGRRLRARCVVVASGARYRRPAVPRLEDFEGRGVWYWASPVEARMCARTEVALVGGGNSAGQAAVFLSGHAARVYMLVRAAGLAASMSRYLIDRIEATPNITLLTHTEVTRLEGTDYGLEAVTWRHRQSGEESRHAIRNLFLFVGADPETDWLQGCGVELDAQGFVRTGSAVEQREGNTPPSPLETSVPGVFAVGDVRAGSVKRVGAAIGEGAAAVAQIHQVLAGLRERG